jgi:hypothetical protein
MFQLTNLSPKDRAALSKEIDKAIRACVRLPEWCARAWESPNPFPVISNAKAAGLTLEQLSSLVKTLGTEIAEARKAQEEEKAKKYVEGQKGDGVSSPRPGLSQTPRGRIVSPAPARNPREALRTPRTPNELELLQGPKTPEQLAEAAAWVKKTREESPSFFAYGEMGEISDEELVANAAAAKQRKKEGRAAAYASQQERIAKLKADLISGRISDRQLELNYLTPAERLQAHRARMTKGKQLRKV